MPIPPLNHITGLLPEGVHVATLPEVRATFGSSNDIRVEIMNGLDRLIDLLRSIGIFKEIYLDGSFVTDKPAPGDVDAVAVMNSDTADLPVFAAHPSAFLLADDKRVQRDYKVQLFLGPRGAGLLSFFQGLKAADALLRGVAPTQKKGILKVIL